MGTTARTLIEQAARKVGVTGRGKRLETDEAMDWLNGLRQMLDAWALEELMVPYMSNETFTLPNSQVVTIGPGGDLDTVRPINIHDIKIMDEAGEPYDVPLVPLTIYTNREDDVVARPRAAYFENGFPLAKIYFDRIPYDPQITIYSTKPLTVYDTVTQAHIAPAFDVDTALDDIEVDFGYEAALIFNLGVYMAPDYEMTPTDLHMGLSGKYKSQIKDRNLRVPNLQVDRGLVPCRDRYDIVEGPG